MARQERALKRVPAGAAHVLICVNRFMNRLEYNYEHEPLVPQRPMGEPFRPVESARAFREFSLAEFFENYRPSFNELFDRLWSSFEDVSRPKSEGLESLTVEVLLSPNEAAYGGQVRVWIPARATCRACGGHGSVGPYECWRCEGHGALTTELPLDLDYSAGLRDGYALRQIEYLRNSAGMNLTAVKLVLDLMHEMEHLRREVRSLRRFPALR